MRIWQVISLAILLVVVPAFSACDTLGIGSSRQQQEADYYRQQLEAIQELQEANRQRQEEYNKRLQEGLNEWADAYGEWQQQQQQQQLGQLGITTTTVNQSATSGNQSIEITVTTDNETSS